MVSAVMPWGSLRLEETGQPLRSDEPDSAGYMTVFTTRTAAEACIERAGIGSPVGGADILEFDSGAPRADEGA